MGKSGFTRQQGGLGGKTLGEAQTWENKPDLHEKLDWDIHRKVTEAEHNCENTCKEKREKGWL